MAADTTIHQRIQIFRQLYAFEFFFPYRLKCIEDTLIDLVKDWCNDSGLHLLIDKQVTFSALRDGVAMVKFLKWLTPAVQAGGQTELGISRKLEELRSEPNPILHP